MKKYFMVCCVFVLGFNFILVGVLVLFWVDEEFIELFVFIVSVGVGGEILLVFDFDDSVGGGLCLGLSLCEIFGLVSVVNCVSFEWCGLCSIQDIVNSLFGVNVLVLFGFGGFVIYCGFSLNQVNQLFNGILV